MSILRIASAPADLGFGGYVWEQTDLNLFDVTRVAGAFGLQNGHAFTVDHAVAAGGTTWYHFRHAVTVLSGNFTDGTLMEIKDTNSNTLARVEYVDSNLRLVAVGTTTSTSGTVRLAESTTYSFDIQIVFGATTTARLYINGALFAERAVTTGAGFTAPTSIGFRWNRPSFDDSSYYFSEIIIADEDTRGMRLRELRPTAFGIFQEWDGSAASVRDSDLSTGISTATADRRVSFGVSNLENIQNSDVINRVVAQTYAQRGETGITKMNHFFRFRNGTVTDGADITLGLFGQYYREEFPLNPSTGLPWVPADFRSLQTGVRSRA